MTSVAVASQAWSSRHHRFAATLPRFEVSKSTFYAGIRSGIYPKPVALSARRVGWRESDIAAALARLKQKGPKPLGS